MRKIYTGQDGVLRRKANFASLVNAVCYSGRRTIRGEELSLVEEELLDSAIALNSTANIDNDGKGIGNPTEAALLLRLKSKGGDYVKMRQEGEIIDRLPFSTER